MARPGSKPELTQSALDALLHALGPDRSAAGEQYELLRQRLVKFFEWRSLPDPEMRADECLNRLARILQTGEPIRDLNSYALGIARLVVLEAARETVRAKNVARDLASICVSPPGAEVRAQCLANCLAGLDDGERHIIVAYYQGEGRTRIEGRKQLAEELNINENALRIRACRIRAALERCMRRCIQNRGL